MPADTGSAGPFSRLRYAMRPGHFTFWLVSGALVTLPVLFLLTLWSFEAVFQVTAESEYIEGRLDISKSKDSTHLRWLLHEPVIQASDEDGIEKRIETSRALLTVNGPAGFEAVRISNGSLRFKLSKIEGFEGNFHVGIERKGGGQTRLYPPVTVTIVDPARLAGSGKTISLPLQAMDVVIGREPRTWARMEQPILRSGEVEVLGRTALQNRVYVAKSAQLREGDVVTATGNQNTFKVLVRLDERPAMQIVARVEARRLAISGFYTDPRFERLTLFNKLANDHLLAGVGTLLGLLFALLSVVVTARPASENDGSPAPPPTLADSGEIEESKTNAEGEPGATLPSVPEEITPVQEPDINPGEAVAETSAKDDV